MATTVVLERVQQNAAGTSSIKAERTGRQRVYIFPTAQGWTYAVMLVVMLLGAINYSNSMAFMLCFLLGGQAIICMLYTYRNLAGLVVTTSAPEPVFAGQPALFLFQFDNQFGQDRYAITLRQKTGKGDKLTPEATRFNIEGGQQHKLHYPVPTSRRGKTRLGRVVVETQFPLGLFRAWAYIETTESALVYPRPTGEKRLPPYTHREEDAETGKALGTDDFAGFRKYRPGDATRSIAWKVYAREQGLLVKQFTGKGSESLMLSWASVSHLPQIEERLSQLCLWLLIAEENGMQYGLDLPDARIEPAFGTTHRNHCLERLALFGLDHEAG